MTLRSLQFTITITFKPSAHVVLYMLYCTRCTVQGVLYMVYCTWCTVQGVLYMVYSTRCTVHGVLYKVYCTRCGSPLNLCQQEVNIVASFLTCFKDCFTLIKEQDGIIDLGFSENELEILSSCHWAQRWEVDQEDLIVDIENEWINKWVKWRRKWIKKQRNELKLLNEKTQWGSSHMSNSHVYLFTTTWICENTFLLSLLASALAIMVFPVPGGP